MNTIRKNSISINCCTLSALFQLPTLLTITLVILKLCGTLNISWWLVFLPIWGPAIISILIVTAIFLFAYIYELYKDHKKL